jgi:two-component system, cell cycle sensor histidine kinase and response regulator CckA
VLQAGERAAWLVNQLLAFSRQQPIKPVVLDLKLVLQDMDKLLRRVIGDDIALVTYFGDAPGIVRADPGQIEQIALNLAANARDAMPTGGRLTIETSLVYLDHSYVRGRLGVQTGSYILLQVSDTGSGIDETTRGHIFEPFFTTKEIGKGTGLGLSTVYGIVQQSGGDIEVVSEPGQGTTFRIYLPLVDAPVTATNPVEHTRAVHYGTETVLVVEDEPSVRALAGVVLRSLGYQVIEASNGPEALTRAVRHPSTIDLVVADMLMPGMSGREVVEQLTERDPDLRVLYMSGFPPESTFEPRIGSELEAFLAKPFPPLELAQKVREVLDHPLPSEAPAGA